MNDYNSHSVDPHISYLKGGAIKMKKQIFDYAAA